MERKVGTLGRSRRWLLALALVSTMVVVPTSPVAAATFTWYSFNPQGNFAGQLTFVDGTYWTKTGSDWNNWSFGDYQDGGYTHLVVLQANVNGSWVTKSSRSIGEGASTGNVSVYLPEVQIRFLICMYTPEGNQTSVPGCLYRYGFND